MSTIAIVLFLVAGSLASSAQQNTSKPKPPLPSSQTNKAQQKWLNRAKLITRHVLVAENSLSTTDTAMLQTRLALAWWKYDQRRAHDWLQSAVEQITTLPQNELKLHLRCCLR